MPASPPPRTLAPAGHTVALFARLTPGRDFGDRLDERTTAMTYRDGTAPVEEKAAKPLEQRAPRPGETTNGVEPVADDGPCRRQRRLGYVPGWL
jgi:hypothetical protein